MSVSINWQPIVGGLLLVAGAVVAAVQWWRSRPASQQAAQTDKTATQPKRSADAPAPPGAVEYIKDIEGALLGAPAEMILECVRSGLSRDAARSVRIQGLLKTPAEPTA